MFRSCLFVVGVRIYSYFRGKACFDVHSLSRYFLTCVTARAGGLTVWRTFFNFSKMMYRLAFSGSRHCVFIILFFCGYCGSPACDLWSDGYPCDPDYEMIGIFVLPVTCREATSVFVSPIKNCVSGHLCEHEFKVSGYLCEPDYKLTRYLCEPDYEFK